MLEKVVSACQDLLQSPEAESVKIYLDNRISSEMQKKFSFGYFPKNVENIYSYLDEMELFEQDLLYPWQEGVDEQFRSPMQEHNLILPYNDVHGKPVALVGRSMLSDDERAERGVGKYKNTSFKKSRHLFGLDLAKKAILQKGYAYVVEGQFDVVQAHASGIENIIALGSSSLAFEQFALLLRYTNDIRLLLDNDDAGIKGRNKAIEQFGKYCSMTSKYVPLGFKDLDEYLKEMSQLEVEDIEAALG